MHNSASGAVFQTSSIIHVALKMQFPHNSIVACAIFTRTNVLEYCIANLISIKDDILL